MEWNTKAKLKEKLTFCTNMDESNVAFKESEKYIEFNVCKDKIVTLNWLLETQWYTEESRARLSLVISRLGVDMSLPEISSYWLLKLKC